MLKALSLWIFIFPIIMNTSIASVKDPHTCARPDEVSVKHIKLFLKPDFQKKEMEASVRITLLRKPEAHEVWLDTRGLRIHSIRDAKTSDSLHYILHPEQEFLGQALQIHLKPETNSIEIKYTVPSGAPALQWLEPQQTLSKSAPFLFTQSQAILARTWIPLQDSPGIRFTYDAQVEVPAGMMALMSAANPQQLNPEGIYSFVMNQPIPSYLMALAVGKLEYQACGRNTGVYAEPESLAFAVYEFGEMQAMLDSAEQLYGPYRWEQYDVLLLPPAFPFGGMENPRLTFATPTILAGDRSLVSLIAHELAHSWSGNLVTNATWNDFWLNEGFTVYFERRIMESLQGTEYAQMLELLGWQDVMQTISDFGQNNPATCLKLNLEGKDPDEGMNDIAYEKGYFFLKTIESLVGREKFDVFLNKHFSDNAFQSLTTEVFIEQLYRDLLTTPELQAHINAERWIYQPGMPEQVPAVRSLKFEAIDTLLQTLKIGEIPGEEVTGAWTTHEWLHFLRHLPETLDTGYMTLLDQAYNFSTTGNSEIASEWFILSFKKGYEPAYEPASRFMIHTGRRKFIVPLYKELIKTESGKKRALEIYEKARPNYHYVATSTLDALLY